MVDHLITPISSLLYWTLPLDIGFVISVVISNPFDYEMDKVEARIHNNSVGCLGADLSSPLLRSNKTPKSSTLSAIGCKVACSLTRSDLWGSTDSGVHTKRDYGPFTTIILWPRIQTQNPIYSWQVDPEYLPCKLLISYSINIAMPLNHLGTSHFNHSFTEIINKYLRAY